MTYYGDPLGLYKATREEQILLLGMSHAEAMEAKRKAAPKPTTTPESVIEATPGAWQRLDEFRVG